MKHILTVDGEEIDNKKTGWLVGKFAPITTGHIYFISMAATMVSNLTVVMSYDGKLFKGIDYLNLQNRLLYLKTVFKDMPHITIKYVDETELKAYPDGWAEWSELVKQVIPADAGYVFSSEPAYTDGFKKHFPTCKHVVIDNNREQVNISATMVRSDPMKYWSFLPSIVREKLVKRVCIIGTESCGKTTLVKTLAKFFQTSWVEEYGRSFCENDLCMSEELLRFDHYAQIAYRRFDMESQAARTANKILFADTNAFITNFYCKLYEGKENPTVSEFEKMEKYDLILFLDDDVEWVADGLRINSDRSKTRELIYEMMSERGFQYSVISGNYNDRMQQAIDLCNELIKTNEEA